MSDEREVFGLSGYVPAVGKALWMLEDCRKRTLRVLDDLPPEHVDQEMQGNTIGTILYHIALIELDWLFTEILSEPFPEELMKLFPEEDRDKDGVLTLIKGQTLDQHLLRLSKIRNAMLDKLLGMTSDDFQRMRIFPQYEVSPEWVLHHLSQHEAEHRGEIGSAITLIKGRS
ncbi:MAG: DinB family protein [Anaerolineaceae bacterium]|nr:DinB family protein [Anaerolineaceae bacterium]